MKYLEKICFISGKNDYDFFVKNVSKRAYSFYCKGCEIETTQNIFKIFAVGDTLYL